MSGRTPENLSAVAAEFRGVAERFSNIVSRVGVTDVADRPSSAGWSIAECLVHLTLVSEAYFAVLAAGLQSRAGRGIGWPRAIQAGYVGKVLGLVPCSPTEDTLSGPETVHARGIACRRLCATASSPGPQIVLLSSLQNAASVLCQRSQAGIRRFQRRHGYPPLHEEPADHSCGSPRLCDRKAREM